MQTFTIEQIFAKQKSEKGKEINNTQKRKIGIEKLESVEYKSEYSQEEKDAIIRLKKALASNSMKSYQQLKLYSNDFEQVKSDIVELSKAIEQAEAFGVVDTTLKLYLSA